MKTKTEILTELVGDKIRVYFKNTMLILAADEAGGEEVVGNAIEGYLIDVDEHYAYVGADLNDGYSHLIDVSDIGLLKIIDEEDVSAQILKLHMSEEDEIH